MSSSVELEGNPDLQDVLRSMGEAVILKSTDEGRVLIVQGDLESFARRLKEVYGTCYAAFLLRKVFGFKTTFIGRLLGIKANAVTGCIKWARRNKLGEPAFILPPERAPELEDLREACKMDTLSLECQMLESELFTYNLAKRSLPSTSFWYASIWLRIAHRLIFPEVYHYLRALQDTRRAGGLFRAVKKGDRWYAGPGIIAYAYAALVQALIERGWYTPDKDLSIRKAVKEMTGVDLMEISQLVYIVSFLVSDLTARKKVEIAERLDRVYRGLAIEPPKH